MQLPEQDFLRLVEAQGTLAFVDIEASGLRGDYNSVLVSSVLWYPRTIQTTVVKQPGNDQKLVRNLKAVLESADCWVTYYGKGFDIPMLNTRLLRWGVPPIAKRPHIDMYYTLKANTLVARRSQGHLNSWLEVPEQKMTVGADIWASVAANPRKGLALLAKRCESDVEGLKDLYERTKHLVREIKR